VVLIGLVLVVLLVRLGWRVAGTKGDLAQVLVSLSARRLASSRPVWGQAMLVELSCVEDRRSRLRFALGCARTAMVPPVAAGPLRARVVVAVVAASMVGLAGVAQRRVAEAPAVGRYGGSDSLLVAVLVLAVLGVHVWLVDRRLRQAQVGAVAARRWGFPVGIVLGVLALLLVAPLPAGVFAPRVAGMAEELLLPVVLAGCLGAGVAAARSSGEAGSGYQAGVWAARVAGAVMAIGLLAATLGASGWFAHDPATVRGYADSVSAAHYGSYGTHFRTIGGYVLSENLDTALIGSLVLFPLAGVVFGALGGVLGAGRHGRRRPTVQCHEMPGGGHERRGGAAGSTGHVGWRRLSREDRRREHWLAAPGEVDGARGVPLFARVWLIRYRRSGIGAGRGLETRSNPAARGRMTAERIVGPPGRPPGAPS
jgi:hypothetical protein